jgi:hypothetical protein
MNPYFRLTLTSTAYKSSINKLPIKPHFRKECETSNKELRHKLVAVEQSCETVETEVMLRGTATQPAPCLMVEWAHDAWRLYHTLYPLQSAHYKKSYTACQFCVCVCMCVRACVCERDNMFRSVNLYPVIVFGLFVSITLVHSPLS